MASIDLTLSDDERDQGVPPFLEKHGAASLCVSANWDWLTIIAHHGLLFLSQAKQSVWSPTAIRRQAR